VQRNWNFVIFLQYLCLSYMRLWIPDNNIDIFDCIIILTLSIVGIRDSVVRMVRATDWMVGNRGSVPKRIGDFKRPLIVTPVLEHKHPPIRQVPAALYLGARCPGREGVISVQWSRTSTPPYAIMTCTRIALYFTLSTPQYNQLAAL